MGGMLGCLWCGRGSLCINRGDWTFSPQVFGNWTLGTLVFTVMVFTVTLKVPSLSAHASLQARSATR